MGALKRHFEILKIMTSAGNEHTNRKYVSFGDKTEFFFFHLDFYGSQAHNFTKLYHTTKYAVILWLS